MTIFQPSLNGIRPRSSNILEKINTGTTNGMFPNDKISKEEKELEKYLNSIEIDKKCVFGTQIIGTPEQYTEQFFKGIINPKGASQDTQSQINKHNKNVQKRARILSYYDHVEGKKLPPRIEAMGLGGGKLPLKMPTVPVDFSFPEWFALNLIPEGIAISPQIRGWSQEAKVQYVESGEFEANLNSGGDVDPELYELWKQKASHELKIGSSAGGGGSSSSSSSSGGGHISSTWMDDTFNNSGDTTLTNPSSFVMPNGSARYNFFRGIMKARGSINRQVISEIWLNKGGKQWMENYLNKTKDTNQNNMNLEWDRIYPPVAYGTPVAEYPQVPIDDTGAPSVEHKHGEPDDRVITEGDYVRPPNPSSSSSAASSSSTASTASGASSTGSPCLSSVDGAPVSAIGTCGYSATGVP